jgi:hypothetical protein
MANQNNYQEHELGFNRTQLFKEWNQPQINRATALKITIEYCTLNDIQLGVKETMQMTKRFMDYLETGNTDWMDKMDSYLEKKKLEGVLTNQ